eukprot:UN26013
MNNPISEPIPQEIGVNIYSGDEGVFGVMDVMTWDRWLSIDEIDLVMDFLEFKLSGEPRVQQCDPPPVIEGLDVYCGGVTDFKETCYYEISYGYICEDVEITCAGGFYHVTGSCVAQDIDCEIEWTQCDENCERVATVTTQPSGNGIQCAEVPPCMIADDLCVLDDRYLQLFDLSCTQFDNTYWILVDATNECYSSPDCIGVTDPGCDGPPYFLCQSNGTFNREDNVC